MSREWIKMRIDLVEDPAVMFMAERLEMDERAVVGYLHSLWSWAWRQCNAGTVTHVTLRALQRVCGLDQLPALMVEVGWLELLEVDGRPVVRFPNWDRHNSQSAKQRALTQQRVDAHRTRPRNAASVTPALPDRDREEDQEILGPGNTQSPDQRGEKPARKAKKTARGRPVRTAVASEVLAPLVDRIFRECGYSGENGGNLWGVAALYETGKGELTEAEIFSACRGAALNGRDKPAHFFATLADTMAKRDQDLRELLREVVILPEWPQLPPYEPLTQRTRKHA